MFRDWFGLARTRHSSRQLPVSRATRRRLDVRPRVEELEGRFTPSSAFVPTGTDVLQVTLDPGDTVTMFYIPGSTWVVFASQPVPVAILDGSFHSIHFNASPGDCTVNLFTTPTIGTPVTIDLGDGTDTVNVERTEPNGPVTINAGAGADAINLSPFVQQLAAIRGTVTVNGNALGNTALTLNDQRETAATGYTIDPTFAKQAGSAFVNYTHLQSLSINGGSAADNYTVNGTAGGTTTTLVAGTGRNIFFVTPFGQNLGSVSGPLALYGSGSDTLSVDDRGDSAAATAYTFADSGLGDTSAAFAMANGTAGASITYTNFQTVTLWGGRASGDLYTVAFTAAGTNLTVNAGGGNTTFDVETVAASASVTLNAAGPNNIFNVSTIDQNLDEIQGALFLNGTGSGVGNGVPTGSDAINLFDARVATYTVDDFDLQVDGVPSQIHYFNVASLVIQSAPGSVGVDNRTGADSSLGNWVLL